MAEAGLVGEVDIVTGTLGKALGSYGGFVAGWPLPLRLVVISVPVTALMTWLVMPHAARLLQRWLYAPDHRP